MKYTDYALELYAEMKKLDPNKIKLDADFSFMAFINSLSQKYSAEELIKLYRKDLEHIIDTKLVFFRDDISMARSVKKISFFEHTLALSICFVIFWIAENDVKISRTDLSKMLDSIYLGSVGYRLFDVHYDSNLIGNEAAVLGNYMLHLGEEMLIDVLGFDDTFKILNKYLEQYTIAEYIEKKNRWKPCPFSWDEPEKIALKTAPVFAIFELAFRLAEVDEEGIKERVKGIKHVSAINQFMDDLIDAKEDLNAGFETLVMTGFYDRHGTEKNVTQEMITEFLDEERLNLFYHTIEDQFEKARQCLVNVGDDLLQLYLEMQHNKFYKDMSIGK